MPDGRSGREDRIHGASYSGFYYLCLSLPDEPIPPAAPTSVRTRSPLTRRPPSFDATVTRSTPAATSVWDTQPFPAADADRLSNPFGIREQAEDEREGRAVRQTPTVPSTPAFEVPSTPKDVDCETQLAFTTATDSLFAPSSIGSSTSMDLHVSSPGADSSASSAPDMNVLSATAIARPNPFSPASANLPASAPAQTDRGRAGLGSASRFGRSASRAREMAARELEAESQSKRESSRGRVEQKERPDFGQKSWAEAEIR